MSGRLKIIWHRYRIPIIGLVLLVLSGGVYGAARFTRSAPTIPTAAVQRGDFVETVRFHGRIIASKSVLIKAPAITGDIQITFLARTGAVAKTGDIIAKFDTAKLEDTLNQRNSEMKQAEAGMGEERAKARLLDEQDRTDLLTARYDVERAKLDASQESILSAIDGAEKKLVLADAEQKLHEVESRQKADQASSQATINGKIQDRTKAESDVKRAERDIAAMTLRAPTDGVVTIFPNFRAGGWFTDNPPEFRPGDHAWNGATIAELPDFSSLQVSTRIDEVDRGRIQLDEAATVRVEAVPDHEFQAHVARVSALAKIDFTTWPPPRNFDTNLQLDTRDPRLRPGMSAEGQIAVNKVLNAIMVPVGAVFTQMGSSVVYVLSGGKFVARPVTIGLRNVDQMTIASGLSQGEKVALKNPMVVEKP